MPESSVKFTRPPDVFAARVEIAEVLAMEGKPHGLEVAG